MMSERQGQDLSPADVGSGAVGMRAVGSFIEGLLDLAERPPVKVVGCSQEFLDGTYLFTRISELELLLGCSSHPGLGCSDMS